MPLLSTGQVPQPINTRQATPGRMHAQSESAKFIFILGQFVQVRALDWQSVGISRKAPI